MSPENDPTRLAPLTDAPQGRSKSPCGASVSEDARGPLTSRPPSNPICYGGEDWLTLSLYLVHRDFERTTKLLDVCRSAAESRRPGEDELQLADQTFLVLPSGAKVGSKRGKAYFRWQLASEAGFLLQLMNLPAFKGTMPNAKLVATSSVMMRLGIDGVARQAFEAIRALGAHVQMNKVSRVDVCCDLPGRSIEPLKSAYEQAHVVCRADFNDEHGGESHFVESDYSLYRVRYEATSFNVGRGDVRIRIYDKVRECRFDLEKVGLLIANRWGTFPAKAIRVEYQLRREKLKQLGIDNLADWMEKRAAVVHYLTHSWFRLTDGPVDRKHPDRTPILPQWREAQDAFAAWTGNGAGPALEAIESQSMPPEHFLKTIVGSFVSLFARTGTAIDGNETFFHESVARILDEIERRDMAAEVRRRALELGVGHAKPREASATTLGEGA
jgi:hypothetical protein